MSSRRRQADPVATAEPVHLASPSQRQYAVSTLRSQIISGRLRPGDRLVEADLAKQLGTSRAPVREALRQLGQEGLVASRPYAATEVIGVTQAEIEEVLVPIRLTVERFAFRAALGRLTESDLDRLDSLVTTMREAGAAGDVETLAEADVRFHEVVLQRSGQPHCLQVWRSIEPRVRAHFRRDAPAHQAPGDLAEEHAQLLGALRARDEQAVVALLEGHILNYLKP